MQGAKAAFARAGGGIEQVRLGQAPIAEPAPGEVLVRLKAASRSRTASATSWQSGRGCQGSPLGPRQPAVRARMANGAEADNLDARRPRGRCCA